MLTVVWFSVPDYYLFVEDRKRRLVSVTYVKEDHGV